MPGRDVATTLGAVAFDAAPTVTRVKAAVEDLVILGRVHVAHAAMGLHVAQCRGHASSR